MSEFYRVLEAAHKNRAKLPGVTNLTLFRKIKEQRNKYRAHPGSAVGDWLIGYSVVLVKWSIYTNMKVI